MVILQPSHHLLYPGLKYLIWDLEVRHLLILARPVLFLVLRRELGTVSSGTYIEKNMGFFASNGAGKFSLSTLVQKEKSPV